MPNIADHSVVSGHVVSLKTRDDTHHRLSQKGWTEKWSLPPPTVLLSLAFVLWLPHGVNNIHMRFTIKFSNEVMFTQLNSGKWSPNLLALSMDTVSDSPTHQIFFPSHWMSVCFYHNIAQKMAPLYSYVLPVTGRYLIKSTAFIYVM
jgi:hypothetical protein